MSQEGANLPQDVEGSHNGITSPGGSTPAGAGSTTVKTAASNSSSSSVKPASPAVTSHAGEGNSAGSKPASPAVIRAGGNNNAGSKAASPAAVDAVEGDAREGKDDVAGGEGAGDAATDGSGGAWSNSMSTKDSSSVDGGVHDVKNAPAAGAGGGSGSGKGKGAMEAEAEHALHIFTERERRKKMKNMFSTLHALLPQLPDKADKATIVGEAVNYIRTLEGTLQRLEKIKKERMRAQQLGVSSNMAPVSSSMRHSASAPKTREAALADMVQSWNTQRDAASVAGGSTTATPQGIVAALPVSTPLQTWSGPNIVLSVAGNNGFITMCTPRQQGLLMKALFVLEKHRIDVVTVNVSTNQYRSMFAIQARINEASTQFSENLTAEDKYKLAVSEMLLLLTK